MEMQSWVLCPICNNKTRTKVREDTELVNFPLFCPNEYSCAVTPQVRQTGNRLSGPAGTAYASLLT